MTRRFFTLTVLTFVLLLGFATPAFGWANGGDNGNGYGSHDWILDEAIRVSGATWVNRTVALAATDDPDSSGVSGIYHMFRQEGLGRGAPSQVALWYEKAVDAYQEGDYTKASKYLGVLSHYYSDICQPFHTEYEARNYDSLHNAYELAVDDYQHQPGNVRAWIADAPRRPITDIRERAIDAAEYSRGQYAALFPAWQSSRSVTNSTVLTVTKRVMSLAVNDLADVISTIPTGNGCSAAPARMTVSMFRTYPAQNANAIVNVACYDASGRPLEGVALNIRWDFASGTVSTVDFTGPDGTTTCTLNVGGAPMMQWVPVTVISSGHGSSISRSTRFMPTPLLADGTSGTYTTLSTTRPYQNTEVTANTLIRDQAGTPVAGLPIVYQWEYASGYRFYRTATDVDGRAACTQNIGVAAIGYRVYVRATTQSSGGNRTSAASFVTR